MQRIFVGIEFDGEGKFGQIVIYDERGVKRLQHVKVTPERKEGVFLRRAVLLQNIIRDFV